MFNRDEYRDHVRDVCERAGALLRHGDLDRMVDALREDDPKSRRLPPPGKVVAVMSEILAARPADALRDGTISRALALTDPHLASEPSGDGHRLLYRTEVVADAPFGEPVSVKVTLDLGRCQPVDDAVRRGSSEVEVAAVLGAHVVPRVSRRTAELTAVADLFREGLASFLASQADDWEKEAFLASLRRRVDALSVALPDRDASARKLTGILSGAFDATVTRHVPSLVAIRFRRRAGYHDYVNTFPLARRMGRRLTLLVGPTNSGKTHEAMLLAASAGRARVLSPLRLLALEHYERLVEAGLAAGMVTGEEVIGHPDPTHVAQTIETLDLDHEVDVAVVDEVQMLVDRDRGWAWTEAVVGVPARHVVMTGSPDVVGMVAHVASLTGEPLEVRVLSRKNPLRALPGPVSYGDLRAGDAVVTFSRRDLFEVRETVTRRGLSVASVYGALSPEVRRAEARRFREGEADVLVATDAIGMGLNIGTLLRVIFFATDKFDGVRRREITAPEARQIAGRAGRFGYAEAGYSGVMEGASHRVVAEALTGPPVPIAERLLYVKPTLRAVRLAAESYPGSRLPDLLERIAEVLERDETTRLADVSDMVHVATLVDDLPLSLDESFHYSVAPVDRRSVAAVSTLRDWAKRHAAGNPVVPYGVRGHDLEDLELSGKMAMLYLWLSRKFPEAYVEVEAVRDHRGRIDEAIEASLVASASARVTNRETRSRGKRGATARKGTVARRP